MTILILLHEESDLYKQIQMVYIWTVYEWVSNCLKQERNVLAISWHMN
jgi:hypothetical protein